MKFGKIGWVKLGQVSINLRKPFITTIKIQKNVQTIYNDHKIPIAKC